MKTQKLIVLMTDFGNDFYVGQMKGVIRSINPKVEIIDLCHNILPQNIIQAAVILHSSYRFFPSGTIFICVVDPGVGTKREILVVKTNGYLFIVPNNGIITKIVETESHCKIYKVYNSDYFLKDVSNTFHGRDIFSPVAAYLSKGVRILSLCKLFHKDKLQILSELKPELIKLEGKKLFVGRYIFHDSFGNIVTNLSSELVDKTKITDYSLAIKYDNKIVFNLKFKTCYSDVNPGEFLVYLNSFGYVEVAVNKGSAYKTLGDKFRYLNKLQFELSYEPNIKGKNYKTIQK
ncbi:MAG: SAM-dependent chlorinase/fluorinase [Endomicrobia bacterium]|nr:SAM-dependent chlorinase/fluorinase [Endomicrobiia bacterium]MDW8055404.1 SAM-dependent chlorinase/fluorinase [Elusimicrobiota bacterium]